MENNSEWIEGCVGRCFVRQTCCRQVQWTERLFGMSLYSSKVSLPLGLRAVADRTSFCTQLGGKQCFQRPHYTQLFDQCVYPSAGKRDHFILNPTNAALSVDYFDVLINLFLHWSNLSNMYWATTLGTKRYKILPLLRLLLLLRYVQFWVTLWEWCLCDYMLLVFEALHCVTSGAVSNILTVKHINQGDIYIILLSDFQTVTPTITIIYIIIFFGMYSLV